MYKITDYSRRKARVLGVDIRPSADPKKKIDVFKGGEKVASIGASGYSDYPTYLQERGKEYAENRRRLYKIRHGRPVKGTPGYYAMEILW